ncbi:MAG: aminoacetone oxidase family FAD-binding enzyme, partial [Cyanobacteria bacterium J06649_11]
GGLSIPKMGATGFGYKIAQQFGIPLVDTKAALVPFMFTDKLLEKAASLAGVSTPDAIVRYGKTAFQEGILFTHRGMSGPSVLQISSYWEEGNPVEINFVPGVNVLETLLTVKDQTPRQEAVTVLSGIIPKRFAVHVCADIAGRKLAECSNAVLRNIANDIQAWHVKPHTTEGYRTAEVTLGGVDTKALSSQTMEAKAVPGLYFIGEVVDVTGHLGGFNFQWAWASGVAAGAVV